MRSQVGCGPSWHGTALDCSTVERTTQRLTQSPEHSRQELISVFSLRTSCFAGGITGRVHGGGIPSLEDYKA